MTSRIVEPLTGVIVLTPPVEAAEAAASATGEVVAVVGAVEPLAPSHQHTVAPYQIINTLPYETQHKL